MKTKDKIKELAAFYNTFGVDNEMSRLAEKQLVNNDKAKIHEAKELAAMARYII